MTGGLIVAFVLAIVVIIVLAKTAVVVPQQNAYIVERLGKYSGTLQAGFHILIPFIDVLRYRLSLKEDAIDIPEQICITKDNVQVGVDGVLYLKVLNPERASYGIANYTFAIIQLAQTTRPDISRRYLTNQGSPSVSIDAATRIRGIASRGLSSANEQW